MKKVWAVKNVESGEFVTDRLTLGVTFGTRLKARKVRNRSKDRRNLRVVPVSVVNRYGQPRA